MKLVVELILFGDIKGDVVNGKTALTRIQYLPSQTFITSNTINKCLSMVVS